MVEEMNLFLTEACQQDDLVTMKIRAILEAADRELSINYHEAELKVMKENGTDEDLAYLREKAEEGLLNTVIKALEKIAEAVVAFFSRIKDSIIELVTNKENKEAVEKIEKKVKLFPLLGRKKVVVENFNEQSKVADAHLTKLSKLKAKLSSKQNVTADDVNEVEKSFIEQHGKAIGVGAAVTVTVAAAIAFIKKMMGDAKNFAMDAEKACKAAIDAGKSMAPKVDNPRVVTALVDAQTSIIKQKQKDFISAMQSAIKQVKEAIKGVGNSNAMPVKESEDTDVLDDMQDIQDDLDDTQDSMDGIPEEDPDVSEDELGDINGSPEPDGDPWDDVMGDNPETPMADGTDEPSEEGCKTQECGDGQCVQESTDDITIEECVELEKAINEAFTMEEAVDTPTDEEVKAAEDAAAGDVKTETGDEQPEEPKEPETTEEPSTDNVEESTECEPSEEDMLEYARGLAEIYNTIYECVLDDLEEGTMTESTEDTADTEEKPEEGETTVEESVEEKTPFDLLMESINNL